MLLKNREKTMTGLRLTRATTTGQSSLTEKLSRSWISPSTSTTGVALLLWLVTVNVAGRILRARDRTMRRLL